MQNIETLSKISDQCTLGTALTVARASCIGGISGEVYLCEPVATLNYHTGAKTCYLGEVQRWDRGAC